MTEVYGCGQSGPKQISAPHDPDSEEVYTFQYRAPVWEANKQYLEKTCGDRGDLAVPSVGTGYLNEAVSSGISGDVEPDWATVTDEQTVDGTVLWQAIPDAFNNLSHGDVITQSAWEISVPGVTLSDEGVFGGITKVKVSEVPQDITEFVLTNLVSVTRVGGDTEVISRSIKVKVKEM